MRTKTLPGLTPISTSDYLTRSVAFWEAWEEWRRLCVLRYTLATIYRYSPILDRVVEIE